MIARRLCQTLLLAALLLAAALPPAAPAVAFERAVAQSVVAVLPPQTGGGEDAGESQPRRGPMLEPEGSAVALAHGLFVTAAHVLGPDEQLFLRLDDGRVFPAKVTARDRATDLALLESAAPARPIQWGEAPLLGDEVCALGNAFGLGISVACGVVSQTGVTHAGFNSIEDFIQTDAAINPGMSGGALVNAKGRLVGVVSAVFTKESDANIGVNFAVSPALAQRVVQALQDDGQFERPRIGVRLEAQPRLEARERAGARVVRVRPEGPAAQAGIAAGDLLMGLAGRAVQRPADAVTALALAEPGSSVTARIWREGEELELALPASD